MNRNYICQAQAEPLVTPFGEWNQFFIKKRERKFHKTTEIFSDAKSRSLFVEGEFIFCLLKRLRLGKLARDPLPVKS